jgi:glycosyltransferase involved in cell wall biosynthesis
MTQPFSKWPSDIYVLVPSYKAVQFLERLLPELLAVVPAAHVCVADDGSHDGTDMVCKKNNVGYVSNLVNKGKGAALVKGFTRLIAVHNARWIITMDADGQHAVSDLPLFVSAIREFPDAGIIIGRRAIVPGKMPLARVFSNALTSRFMSLLTGSRILDSQCGFRAYSARCINAAPCRYFRFEMESEIIMRACAARFSVIFIAVQTLYFSSPSHISHVADTLRWLKAVLTIFLEMRNTKQLS